MIGNEPAEIPTPEQIAERCAIIRSAWSAAERERRRYGIEPGVAGGLKARRGGAKHVPRYAWTDDGRLVVTSNVVRRSRKVFAVA